MGEEDVAKASAWLTLVYRGRHEVVYFLSSIYNGNVAVRRERKLVCPPDSESYKSHARSLKSPTTLIT